MTDFATTSQLMLDYTAQIFAAAQTEIALFLVALCTYAVFSFKLRAPAAKSMPATCAGKRVRGPHAKDCKVADAAKPLPADAALNNIVKRLQNGQIQEARTAIQARRDSGLQINRTTFNELLVATIKSGNEGWSIVDEMQACGMKPDHITCTILLKTIQKKSTAANGVLRILAMLDTMEGDFDEVLLNSIIEACVRVGRADLIIPQLQHERAAKIQVQNAYTYASIIRAYGCVGDLPGMWNTWREMRKCHVVPTSIALGCMVEALTTNGEVEASYELLHEMLNDDECKPLVNSVVYGSVLKGFSHQKQFGRVLDVYQEMLDNNLKFSIITFNTLFDAFARSGEMGRVSNLLTRMTDQGVEPDIITYGVIVKGYCQENRLDDALAVLDEMLKRTSFKPDEVMYNTLLAGCTRQALYDRGMLLFEEMQQAGIRPTNFTLSVLVKLACRSKKQPVDKAFKICSDVTSKYNFRLNIHVFNNLLQSCIRHHDSKRTFDTLAQMVRENVRPDGRTFLLLLPAVISAGQATEAGGLIRAAFGLQGTHPAFESKSASFAQVQGGLPLNLLVESLEGIGRQNVKQALDLIKDLQRSSTVKIPEKLKMQFAIQAARA